MRRAFALRRALPDRARASAQVVNHASCLHPSVVQRALEALRILKSAAVAASLFGTPPGYPASRAALLDAHTALPFMLQVRRAAARAP